MTDSLGASVNTQAITISISNTGTPPTITITSPTNATTLAASAFPQIIPIVTATTTSGTATVAYVEYYEGTNLLVSTSAPTTYAAQQVPFRDQWPALAAGTYSITAKITDSKGNTATAAPITLTITDASGETITFLHNDFAGSAIAATDSAGQVRWKENYDQRKSLWDTPFGDRAVKDPLALNNRQWFTGKPQDSETGLSYFGARYYDPVVGRFMGIDAVGFEEKNIHSFNRYAYGNNNPYKYVDPDGRSGQLVINSSGNGGSFMADGHAWISYTPDGGKATTTYGTWGNNPQGLGNGLQANLETGRQGDASRGMHLNDAQEKNLMSKISEYQGKGSDGWQYSAPSSAFASDAWQAGTNEKLNANWGAINNPTTLKESIMRANEGMSHLNANQANKRQSSDSSTGVNSSSISSGSSLNSAGKLLQ